MGILVSTVNLITSRHFIAPNNLLTYF